MSWLKIDDGFVENTKVLELTDRGFRLHMAGLCYCARNLTDGILVMRAVKVVCALTAATRRHLVELRDAGLWVALEDGYEIKDYLDYNPDAATVKARQAERSASGKRGADSRWHGKPDSNSDSSSHANGYSSRAKPRPVPSPITVSKETALAVVDSRNSQSLLAEFITQGRNAGVEVPSRVKGHLAKAIKDLLDDGQTPKAVWAGLGRMIERRIVQPGLLANFVVEASLPPRRPASDASRFGRGMTTDQILRKAAEA